MFNIDYDRLVIDHSMFIHKFNDMIVIIYVNDMLICDFKKDDILNFKEKLIERFRIKNFESVSYYLNVKVVRDRENRTMHLSQINYIRQLVEECDLTNCKSASTSMKQIFLKHDIFDDESYQTSIEKLIAYVEIIDKLQWISNNTRQDIAYAINKLAQFMKNSTSTHSQTLKRIVRYLTDIMKLEKYFESSESHDESLFDYIDSSYDDDELTKRSHSNYIFMLWNDFVSHATRRQNSVTTSSIEAEYVDQCNASKKTYFLIQIFEKLDEKISYSMKIRADNQSAIALINNSDNHRRTKHISIQYHYVRKLMKVDLIRFTYVSIQEMMIDDLTKSLRSQLFKKFVRMLELVLASQECD